MRYPAYLELGPNGHTIAYVFALPGLVVRTRRADDALAALPAAVAAELARLRAAGRAVAAEDDAIAIAEAERITVATDVEHGVTQAMFKYELRPTRDEDVALALDRMALAREEILRALEGAEPGGTPAGEALVAQADGEWWLVSKLGTRPLASFPLEPLARFEAVRAMTIERLANLLPGDRERHAVFGGEQWTTRKVLRRLACLARDTAQAIAQAAMPRA
ncbi:MAG: hypothetical protein ABI960_01700 [Candidatus Eisenbacteria bacterium]